MILLEKRPHLCLVASRAMVRLLAGLTVALSLCLAGCKSSVPPVQHASEPAVRYPARPAVAPPAFKVFHQDNDTYTLTTKEDASDDEIKAILWQLREANHEHTFDRLHLSQKFMDARAPKVWVHLYRGPKCAGEKFIKGDTYPCGAAYHGAADYTLGGFKNANYEEGVLRTADGREVELWDAEKPWSAQ